MRLMAQRNEARVYAGPAGWSYEDWKGVVYPPHMPRGLHALAYLCRFFDTVEINASFYRPPAARNCAAWVAKVAGNPDFLFTAKIWQRYTHERGGWPGEAEHRMFADGLAPLAEAGRLGALLAQFPWSFKRTPENRQWLARVADAFAAYPLVIEVRHDSWNRPEVIEEFARRGIALCNIDQPLFARSIAPADRVTASVGYVRLHGRNADAWFDAKASRDQRYDYLYSPDELKPWVERVRRMRPLVDRLFVVTNNHYRGQAVVNTVEIMAALRKERPAFPACLAEHYPRLLDTGEPVEP
jgi:uncharacterized protein YecE (DUF72 family)